MNYRTPLHATQAKGVPSEGQSPGEGAEGRASGGQLDGQEATDDAMEDAPARYVRRHSDQLRRLRGPCAQRTAYTIRGPIACTLRSVNLSTQ